MFPQNNLGLLWAEKYLASSKAGKHYKVQKVKHCEATTIIAKQFKFKFAPPVFFNDFTSYLC